jgi:hypothetical protein
VALSKAFPNGSVGSIAVRWRPPRRVNSQALFSTEAQSFSGDLVELLKVSFGHLHVYLYSLSIIWKEFSDVDEIVYSFQRINDFSHQGIGVTKRCGNIFAPTKGIFCQLQP